MHGFSDFVRETIRHTNELAEVNERLVIMDRKLDRIMTDTTALQAAATQISTDVGEAVTALNDLSAKLASGGTVSQAEIDGITSTLTTASSNLDAAVATDDPPPTPVA